MYERHLLLKCHRAEDRDALEARTRAALAPGAPNLWLGRPADAAAARSWDLALRVAFATAAELEAWCASPAVAAWQAEVAHPAAVVLKAWSFTAA